MNNSNRVVIIPCNKCDGSGEIETASGGIITCEYCEGTGKIPMEETEPYSFEVPLFLRDDFAAPQDHLKDSSSRTSGGESESEIGKKRIDDIDKSGYQADAARGGAFIGLIIGAILLLLLKVVSRIFGFMIPSGTEFILIIGSVLIVAAVFTYIQSRVVYDIDDNKS